jgi:glycine oxidase
VRVLVLGAGVIGACVADALARRGVDVTVLDMRAPGRGATQASAGVLAPFIEADATTPLLGLATRGLDLYDDFIAGLRERTGLAIEYARTGTLEVALSDQEAEHLRSTRATLDARRVAYEWHEGSSLRRAEPTVSESAVAGLLILTHGFVGVASLMKAIVQSARLAGAAFEQPIEAARVETTANGVTVHGSGRTYTGDCVVIAAGSWSNRVRVSGATVPVVKPIRGQLLHLAWGDGLPARSVWGTACYTVPWSDGSLLVGATVEDVGFDERSTVAGIERLSAAVQALLPRASTASIEAVRVGLRPASIDGLPYIGSLTSSPRVIMASGHYRNGVLLAPLTGELVAGLVADGVEDPALAVTNPNRATPAAGVILKA